MLQPRKALTQKKKIKEDKFATGLVSFWDMVKKHGRNILYGAGGAAAVILIVTMVRSSSASARKEARLALGKADAAADAGNTDEAITRYRQMVETLGSNDYTGRACLSLGKLSFSKGDMAGAEKYFNLYLDKYSDGMMDPAAGGGLAACAENTADFKKAADLYRKTAKQNSGSHLAPGYLAAAARCYRQAGDVPAAKECLQAVVDGYEETDYARDAKAGLAELKALAVN